MTWIPDLDAMPPPLPDEAYGFVGNGVEEPSHQKIRGGRLHRSDLQGVPPRRWLYGRKLIRGYVSLVAAPGGVGKSAWVAAVACDLADGRQSLYDQPHGELVAWVYNLEDPLQETMRKIEAIMLHKHLPDSVLERLLVNSGRDRPLILAAELPNRTVVAMPDVEEMIEACLENHVDVLTVDPVVRSHKTSENDNKSMDMVMDLYAQIAARADVAVLLAHHSRKGFSSAGPGKGGHAEGDADTIRGASAIVSSARVALVMQPMSREEASDMNVPEVDRRSIVRLDSAKRNLAIAALDSEWLRLANVNINNATPEYPDGDWVQVAERWTPPDAWDGISPTKANDILDRIAHGFVLKDGSCEPYTLAPQSERWVGHAIAACFEPDAKSKDQIKVIAKKWIDTGVLAEEEYMSASQSKLRKGVVVKSRPGNFHPVDPADFG